MKCKVNLVDIRPLKRFVAGRSFPPLTKEVILETDDIVSAEEFLVLIKVWDKLLVKELRKDNAQN